MRLAGVTLIKNGNRLRYPWKQCIYSLRRICDDVWISYDPTSDDNTAYHLVKMGKATSNLFFHSSVWDMNNRDAGTELAKQINVVLPKMIGYDWILYLQADEFIHEKEIGKLRNYLNGLSEKVTQVELFRTYFWGDLKHRAPEHEIWLGRIFRPGTHEVGTDGMNLTRFTGQIVRYDGLIYHYSRIGDPSVVTARIRSLDHMFHPPETVATFPDFSYDEFCPGELVEFDGPHPRGIEEFYGI